MDDTYEAEQRALCAVGNGARPEANPLQSFKVIAEINAALLHCRSMFERSVAVVDFIGEGGSSLRQVRDLQEMVPQLEPSFYARSVLDGLVAADFKVYPIPGRDADGRERIEPFGITEVAPPANALDAILAANALMDLARKHIVHGGFTRPWDWVWGISPPYSHVKVERLLKGRLGVCLVKDEPTPRLMLHAREV